MPEDISPTDPQENMNNKDHLPGIGEVNPNNIFHHDPLTTDTSDD